MIPYSRQLISENDIKNVIKVLKSKIITQGKKVEEFEKKLSEYCNAKFAVTANSATSALHIACISLGLKKNDYLWTVPNTFVASSNCALYCGAKADFVDIDPSTNNISIFELKKKLKLAKSKKKLPKIIVVVHFGGHPCDLKEIKKLSKRYKFKIIEDASHALGATYKKERIGNCKYSDITVFSFHPVKSITTAEGGAALTNDKKLYEEMSMLRTHGITKDKKKFKYKKNNEPWYFEQQLLGYNYRMNEIEATLGISQLRSLDTFIKKRLKIAKIYDKYLSNLPIITPIKQREANSSYHLYTIRIKNGDRKKIFNFLRKNKIGVNVHYIPVVLHPFYKKLGFKLKKYPHSLSFYRDSISIPIYPDLKFKDQLKVIRCIKSQF
jgi:UDP-4-amino-4,6-dideoxy-N-acetyl-beta-L-altrosamine transaminase